MKHISILLLAMVAVSTPALAQDAPQGGARVEANFGWDQGRLSGDGSGTKSGVSYGGEIGYDFPLGTSVVAGPYAYFDGSSVKDCVEDATASECLKMPRTFGAGVRVGTYVSPSLLLYGKAGYANGRLTYRYRDTAVPADDFDQHFNRGGFQLGAGVQYDLGSHLYTKLEYTYARYGKIEDDDFSMRMSRNRVTTAIGFRF